MLACSCGDVSYVGILVASVGTFVASYLVSWMDDRRKMCIRKQVNRATASAVIGAYLMEVQTGISVLKQIAARQHVLLPVCAWMNFKMTTDVISEILLSAKDENTITGFKTKDFLNHLKNYFEYLCPNVNNQLPNVPPAILLQAQSAATDIEIMLKRILNNLKGDE